MWCWVTSQLVILNSSSLQNDDEPISELNIQEYQKQVTLVSQEPVCSLILFLGSLFPTLVWTLYAGTIHFNILLSAIKPVSEVTQEQIEQACHNANILDFVNSLPEFMFIHCSSTYPIHGCLSQICSGFNTEVDGKGSQLSEGQKCMLNLLKLSVVTLTNFSFRTHCHCLCTAPQSKSPSARWGTLHICSCLTSSHTHCLYARPHLH